MAFLWLVKGGDPITTYPQAGQGQNLGRLRDLTGAPLRLIRV